MRLGGSFGADASQLNSAEACWASLVMSTRTGPGRPLLAIRKASRMVRATSSAFVTTTLCLVMGMVMPVISISWNASEPRTLLLTWPVMQTTGEESSMAVAIPVTMFVAPGPDVAMATSGPGATNMVTGIATAMLDSSPVVCITGQVSSKVLGSDAFQEIDITGITMPITKHNVVVTKAEDVARTLREAFLIANSGRPGPVLVDITKDAQQASAEFNWEASAPKLPPKRVRNNHDQADFDRAVEMLNTAKRPIILAGHGIMVSGAMRAFEQFVRAGNYPVAMTLLGIGCFPANNPLNLGMMGMHGEAWVNNAIQEADLL